MNRSGVVLVEVLAATTILALVGTALIGFAAELGAAQERVFQREDELRRAESILIAYSLLDRSALAQRIGAREVAGHVVYLDRPEANLFRIGVASEQSPEVEILATLLFRPAIPSGQLEP